jgi:hypothetical protein
VSSESHSARSQRAGLFSAAACICLALVASAARAQSQNDAALARLEAIDTLRFGILRIPTATLGLRDDAPSGSANTSAAFGFGVALAGLEKRGTAWEAVRLDHFRVWTHSEIDVAFTLLDLSQLMIGTDIDHDLCIAAPFVITHGDCQHGGWFGIRAQLLHHAYGSESARWFHRWFEVGAVLSPFGDSFDVDFVRARMPITLGVSLDHVANVPVPAGEAAVRLRGVASLAGVLRFAEYRLELTGAVDYRPALAPFDFAGDSATSARLKLAYVWLAALFGAIRAPAQRLYLEARASHWDKPWLSDQPIPARNTLEITIGFELGLREVTPS